MIYMQVLFFTVIIQRMPLLNFLTEIIPTRILFRGIMLGIILLVLGFVSL